MNTLQLQRFEGVAKFLRVLVKIVWILVLVFAAISAIAAIATLFIPIDVIRSLLDPLNGSNVVLFSIENFTFQISDIILHIAKFKFAISIGFIALSLALLAGAYVLYQLTQILENVANKTPFSEQAIASTKKLSIGIIFYSVLESIGLFVTHLLVSRFFTQSEFDYTYHVDLDFNLDLTLIVVALMVFLLAKVFEYGASLQHEVDELL